MKWAHLPEAGGIYDQNPGLIDRFYYIMAQKAKWAEQERQRQEREQSRGKSKPKTSGRR